MLPFVWTVVVTVVVVDALVTGTFSVAGGEDVIHDNIN